MPFTNRPQTVHEPLTDNVHEHLSLTVCTNRSRTSVHEQAVANNSNTFTTAIHEQRAESHSQTTVHERVGHEHQNIVQVCPSSRVPK